MDRRNPKRAAFRLDQQKGDSFRPWLSMRSICTFLLALAPWACAGGSGSSGFDVSPAAENEAINQALVQRQCQPGQGLIVCPANEDSLDVPGQIPTPPLEGTNVGTDANPTDFARCVAGSEARCRIPVSVNASGLPVGASYQVAGRGLEPLSTWTISDPAVSVADGDMVSFGAQVEVPSASAAFQVAVLVFVDGIGTATGEVDTLTETGATLGFVSGRTPIPR